MKKKKLWIFTTDHIHIHHTNQKMNLFGDSNSNLLGDKMDIDSNNKKNSGGLRDYLNDDEEEKEPNTTRLEICLLC